jgi:hypothetical protein
MSMLATQCHSQSHLSHGGGGGANSFTHDVSVADPSFLSRSVDEWVMEPKPSQIVKTDVAAQTGAELRCVANLSI